MRKHLKKITAVAIICCSAVLSACGLTPKVEGDDLINKAREDYASLDSAVVVMTNMETGEIEQTFTFKYDEKDVLMYSYEGKSENSEYAQYNNGMESFTYDNGEYSYAQKGDDDFDLYTRSATHPQADEGLILLSPTAISDASVTDEDGITHIHHVYDVSKINAEVESGEVTAFYADYYFSGDELLYFVETTESEDNGVSETYAYKVEITEKNSVEKVENTVDKYKDENKSE